MILDIDDVIYLYLYCLPDDNDDDTIVFLVFANAVFGDIAADGNCCREDASDDMGRWWFVIDDGVGV